MGILPVCHICFLDCNCWAGAVDYKGVTRFFNVVMITLAAIVIPNMGDLLSIVGPPARSNLF